MVEATVVKAVVVVVEAVVEEAAVVVAEAAEEASKARARLSANLPLSLEAAIAQTVTLCTLPARTILNRETISSSSTLQGKTSKTTACLLRQPSSNRSVSLACQVKALKVRKSRVNLDLLAAISCKETADSTTQAKHLSNNQPKVQTLQPNSTLHSNRRSSIRCNLDPVPRSIWALRHPSRAAPATSSLRMATVRWSSASTTTYLAPKRFLSSTILRRTRCKISEKSPLTPCSRTDPSFC